LDPEVCASGTGTLICFPKNCKTNVIKTRFSALIQARRIETAIRKSTRPSVKENGTLITAAGQLRITSVKKINYEDNTDKEIIDAGYSGREALDAELSHKDAGEIYKITFKLEGEDPRIN